MKTKIILTSLFLGLFRLNTTTAVAQKGGNKGDRKAKKEKFDSLKKEFFNSALSLSETEKSKFWPMYEEYNAKQRSLKKAFRTKYKKNDIIYMDETKAKQYLTDLNNHKEELLELDKTYQTKFLTFLSAKKVVMIHRTERDWQQKMRDFLKNRAKK